jgi:DNA-binding response OmpR family regulator
VVKRILLIDAGSAKAINRLLTSAGYEVATAADEESGLALAVGSNPDLVILAIRMPIDEGLSVAKHLRERAPAVPMMFVSASKEPRLREAATSLHVVGFVEKPYDPSELLPAVSQALQAASLSVTAESPLRKLPSPAQGIKTSTGDAPASGPSFAAPPPEAAAKKILILLVEDDRKIALALSVRLRHAGLEVMVAYDATTGLTAALKERPDLVLADIGLPGGSGLKLMERLRSLSRSLTPVVFVTASRKPGLREEAMALGASGFLEKPFEAEELIATIQQALGL